ncbi:hypothetical protein DICPUDRAFT_76322 [Dictyostelium purpureum]|uniref:Uncharacterized protein n=1 Tax=Dictyostelium purpureum TaxID=5786 RepID=F0ZD94_DICPU|nr:uncharacterized protein DICPUDRAFT_76322 [Dictyostelium purpureum]EGC38098.1 hypothetical protein DICPUDRAFT_76322 [Dictyostelium purpureum]|eukprot:XP_003285405.1 hypothetical protein DICPUDRAFT_76322 [Dictyostelium purpureum]
MLTKVYICKYISKNPSSFGISSHWGLLVAGKIFHIMVNHNDNDKVIYDSIEFNFNFERFHYSFVYIGRTQYSLGIIGDTAQDLADKFVYDYKKSNCQDYIYKLGESIVKKLKFPLKSSDLFDPSFDCTTKVGSKISILCTNLTEQDIINERNYYLQNKEKIFGFVSTK